MMRNERMKAGLINMKVRFFLSNTIAHDNQLPQSAIFLTGSMKNVKLVVKCDCIYLKDTFW